MAGIVKTDGRKARATALTFFHPENKDINRNSSRKISHKGTEFTEDTKKDRN